MMSVEASAPRARWVYIAGDNRSGSTLLADLLAQSLGAFNAGELGRLWECLERGQLCTCGEPIDVCVIWSEVIDRVRSELGLNAKGDALEIANHGIDHPTMLRRRKLTPPSRREVALRDATERALESVTGAKAIVDATKTARTLWVAAHLDRRLTAVHIVRDSRAVTFACMSDSARDPSLGGRLLGKQPVSRSAMTWNVRHLACLRVLRARPPAEIYKVRYEDLATQPEVEIARLTDGDAGEFSAFASVSAGDCHSLGGNPRRFGSSAIKLDERWHSQMATWPKALATVLTAPMLRTFRYELIPKQRL